MAWSYPPGTAHRLSSSTAEFSALGGPDALLSKVNINTPSTSASLAVYTGPFPGGTPSTTGTKVATIDCSSNARTLDWMIRCPGGVYTVLTPAATGADVSVVII